MPGSVRNLASQPVASFEDGGALLFEDVSPVEPTYVVSAGLRTGGAGRAASMLRALLIGYCLWATRYSGRSLSTLCH